MADFIDTGNTFKNAIVNVDKLLKEYQEQMNFRDIWLFDNQLIGATPCISIVFDNAIPQVMNIGLHGRCRALQTVNLLLYFYLETWEPGMDTLKHIEKMGELNSILFGHNNLYGLCHTEAMTITNVALGGRRLETNSIYLTGQFSISVPQRFSITEHP